MSFGRNQSLPVKTQQHNRLRCPRRTCFLQRMRVRPPSGFLTRPSRFGHLLSLRRLWQRRNAARRALRRALNCSSRSMAFVTQPGLQPGLEVRRRPTSARFVRAGCEGTDQLSPIATSTIHGGACRPRVLPRLRSAKRDPETQQQQMSRQGARQQYQSF